jgi:hypothetical protein
MKNHQKIHDRCAVLEQMILQIAPLYHTMNEDQQRLVTTTIGAALFYVPHGEATCYSGFVSAEAYGYLRSGKKTTLTKEHRIPRRLSALELINKAINNEPLNLMEAYLERYSKFNYVLPKENKRLIPFQKENRFSSPEEAYDSAGIELVPLSLAQLKAFRRMAA